MLSPRVLLLALVVAASATFAVGVALERSNAVGHHEVRKQGESAADRAAETASAATPATGDADSGSELGPLGIDIEAWPFVAAAVLASLALALVAWLRPEHPVLLVPVAVAMLAFAALDAREVAHQVDINKNGLAILAAIVAVLHLAAAAVAASMPLGSRRPRAGFGGRAGTMAP